MTTYLQQLRKCSFLHNIALVEYEDAVAVSNCRESVSYDYLSLPTDAVQSRLNFGLILGIKCRSCFVQ
jgi:hypothetical protein